VHRRGLFGREHVYNLTAGFRFDGERPTRLVYTTGLVLTVATSVLVILAGFGWVAGRRTGRLVVLIPATLFAASFWWPAVHGCNGGGPEGGYRYSRGEFGYLVEYRSQFEPTGFPPWETPVVGRLGLNPLGLGVTAMASGIVVLVGWWMSRSACDATAVQPRSGDGCV
jgi:hypothetical protein